MPQTQICKVGVPLRFQEPTIKMLPECWSAARCHARPGCCLRANIYIRVTACIPTETLGLPDLLTCHWHYEKWWCSSQGIKVDKAWSQTTHLINAKEANVHQDEGITLKLGLKYCFRIIGLLDAFAAMVLDSITNTDTFSWVHKLSDSGDNYTAVWLLQCFESVVFQHHVVRSIRSWSFLKTTGGYRKLNEICNCLTPMNINSLPVLY